MMANVITEYTYILKSKFASVALFVIYIVIAIIKIILPILITLI